MKEQTTLIKVFDGILDARKLSLVTPVMESETHDKENNVIPLFVMQITCDGTRSTLNYDTKEEAERERNFIINSWMDAIGCNAITVLPEEPKKEEAKEEAEGETDVEEDKGEVEQS